MSSQTITHSCGHEESHGFGGPYAERERKAAWMATTLCSDCYAAEKAAKAAKQATSDDVAIATLLADAAATLPALQGSEKQIKWATDIRHTALATIALFYAAKKDALNKEKFFGMIAALVGESHASFWIDNRSNNQTVTTKYTQEELIILAKLIFMDWIKAAYAEKPLGTVK